MGCLKFNTTESLTWLEANNFCEMEEYVKLVEIKSSAVRFRP